jgi:hypothetical protein
MNDFERTINKWRTATDTNILIDGKDGFARATVKLDGYTTVTIESPVDFEGDPYFIEPDDLKILKRVDNLLFIHGTKWVGDLEVNTEPRMEVELEPVNPVEGEFLVERDELDYVLLAASTDQTRPVLNAVYFENDRLVTTDGFRLHFSHGCYNDGKENVMVDSHLLKRIKSDFRIMHLDDHSIITFEDKTNKVIIKTKWIVGTFPDYRAIVPDNTKINFEIQFDPRKNRFKKVATDKIGIVTLQDGMFEYVTQPDQSSDIRTKFSTKAIGLDLEEPVKFGIRPDLFYEALKGSPVKVGLNAPTTPIVIGDSAIIMPMHIRGL